jgi:ATP-dependent exoDNAse (exonuclease V) alpha subunit
VFSTDWLLRCEQLILDSADRRQAARTAVVALPLIDQAVAAAGLNADQATAVRALADSASGVDVVQAPAGTGKTTMLRALADAYRRAGYRVIGAAPTARAARELRDVAGVQAGTVHALAADLDRRCEFAVGSVLLLDEAGMASTRVSARLFEHASAPARR